MKHAGAFGDDGLALFQAAAHDILLPVVERRHLDACRLGPAVHHTVDKHLVLQLKGGALRYGQRPVGAAAPWDWGIRPSGSPNRSGRQLAFNLRINLNILPPADCCGVIGCGLHALTRHLGHGIGLLRRGGRTLTARHGQQGRTAQKDES